jgi:hypothetical protein
MTPIVFGVTISIGQSSMSQGPKNVRMVSSHCLENYLSQSLHISQSDYL